MYDVWNLGKQVKYFLVHFMKIFFFFFAKEWTRQVVSSEKRWGHYGHFYWALVLGTYLGFGPHILV